MATRARRINTQQTTDVLDDILIGEDITESAVDEISNLEEIKQQDVSPIEIETIPFESLDVVEELIPEIPIVQVILEEPMENNMPEVQNMPLTPEVESEGFLVNIETHVFKLSPDAIVPKQANKESYFDLSANFTGISSVLIITKDNIRINKPVLVLDNNRQFRGIVLEGHDRALIPTNLKFNIPENCKMNIYSKPGLSFNSGLTLCSGVDIIGSSYKDQIYISVHNTSNIRCTIKSGDKIAQAEIVPFFIADIKLIT